MPAQGRLERNQISAAISPDDLDRAVKPIDWLADHCYGSDPLTVNARR